MDHAGHYAPAPQHALPSRFPGYGTDPLHHHAPYSAGAPFASPHGLDPPLRLFNHDSPFSPPFAQGPQHHPQHHHGFPMPIAPAPSPLAPNAQRDHRGRVLLSHVRIAQARQPPPQPSPLASAPQPSPRFAPTALRSPRATDASFPSQSSPRGSVTDAGRSSALSAEEPARAPEQLPAPAGKEKKKEGSHFEGLKMIPDPPDLQEWREKLFNVKGNLVLSEDEFQTYFPHVDNVYSHRSTQRHKRHAFVSHYWDCRLIGRPSGTPKSDDPAKKKRKRVARQRDLCHVKIKIVEHFPGAADAGAGGRKRKGGAPTPTTAAEHGGSAGTASGRQGKTYEIAMVGGTDPNNFIGTLFGAHEHTLEDSDRIKKNSVIRHFMALEKGAREDAKTYHKRATGAAAQTVKRHAREHELRLYGSCFCPFVQRVWIALELKGVGYEYVEVDPYKKPASLLDVNPLGLVPALRHGDWACHESTVLVEYLEDAFPDAHPLLPRAPRARAGARLWADHVHRKVVPSFYALLQAQDGEAQAQHARALHAALATLTDAADPQGPFFAGAEIGYVDVQLAPWLLRLRRVLAPYRGWPAPEEGSRWARWVRAVEECEAVKRTTSGDELYLDSYERYAQNRPNTSQVADAINSGRPLP